MTADRTILAPPVTESAFQRFVRRTILSLLTPFLIAGAISSHRAYFQVRRLDLHLDGPALRAGSAARADAVCSGRVPVTLQIELVQGTQAETLAMKIVANSKDPFFDPRTVKGTLSVALTPEVLARFAPGPALIRATARGRSQWMREPPPLIREVPVLLESAFTSREAPRGVSAMRVRARNLLKRGGRATGCSIVS